MMPKLSIYAFRFRFAIHLVIYVLGFVAPWDKLTAAPTSLSTWLVTAALVARQQWLSFTAATVAVLVLATALATAAAALRTWATAMDGADGG